MAFFETFRFPPTYIVRCFEFQRAMNGLVNRDSPNCMSKCMMSVRSAQTKRKLRWRAAYGSYSPIMCRDSKDPTHRPRTAKCVQDSGRTSFHQRTYVLSRRRISFRCRRLPYTLHGANTLQEFRSTVNDGSGFCACGKTAVSAAMFSHLTPYGGDQRREGTQRCCLSARFNRIWR